MARITVDTEVDVDIELDEFSDRELLEEVRHRYKLSVSFKDEVNRIVEDNIDDEWEVNTALDVIKLGIMRRNYKYKDLDEIERFFTQ
jgi:hypothetical protein